MKHLYNVVVVSQSPRKEFNLESTIEELQEIATQPPALKITSNTFTFESEELARAATLDIAMQDYPGYAHKGLSVFRVPDEVVLEAAEYLKIQ